MAAVPAVLAPHCTFPAASGSSVAPLIDGVPTFKRLEELFMAATSSVYVGLSFIDVKRWRHPVSEESFVDWMDRLARDRGLDVRILCWRLEFKNPVLAHGPGGAGWDSSGPSVGELRERGARFKLRFDSSGPDHRHCHHEKSWVVDGDTESPVAVLGGITVTSKNAVATPGHPYSEYTQVKAQRCHDVNVEVRGSAARDCATHFVQRWNAAHRHAEPNRHYPDAVEANDLREPPPVQSLAGGARAQVLRTVRPQQLPMRPGGEASIYEQWRQAIDHAQSTIYIEQQHICHPGLLRQLARACDRGVRVVYVVPSVVLEERLPPCLCALARCALQSRCCSRLLAQAQRLQWWCAPLPAATTLAGTPLLPESLKVPFLDQVPELAANKNFCLVGLHSPDLAGRASSIYVHSKMIIVDDAFLLVGSANLVGLSMDPDHTELAVACWDRSAARAMRDALYAEHAGEPLPEEHMDDPVAALKWLKQIAAENAAKPRGEALRGRVCQLDGRLYGNAVFLLAMTLDWLAARSVRSPLSFSCD